MALGHERDIITWGENFRSKFSMIRADNCSQFEYSKLYVIPMVKGKMVSWIEESNERNYRERHKEGWRKNMYRVIERERERKRERENERKRAERKSVAKRKLSIYSKRYLTTTRAIYRHAFQHTAWKRIVRKRSFKEKIHTLTYIPGTHLNLYNVQGVSLIHLKNG